MASRIRPRTDLGEVAVARLSQRFGHYLQEYLESNIWNVSGNEGRRSFTDLVGTQQDHAVVDLLSIAEHFTTARVLRLNHEITERDVATWEERKNTLRNSFGVDLEDVETFPDWPPLLGFVEARNALQHGLGTLTARQLVRWRALTLRRLADAGISMMGDRVVIEDQTVRDCHSCAEAFILTLDAMLPPREHRNGGVGPRSNVSRSPAPDQVPGLVGPPWV